MAFSGIHMYPKNKNWWVIFHFFWVHVALQTMKDNAAGFALDSIGEGPFNFVPLNEKLSIFEGILVIQLVG